MTCCSTNGHKVSVVRLVPEIATIFPRNPDKLLSLEPGSDCQRSHACPPTSHNTSCTALEGPAYSKGSVIGVNYTRLAEEDGRIAPPVNERVKQI